MSLNNAALIEGATMNAATGGTALSFVSQGNTAGQNILYVSTDTQLNTRRSLVCNASGPKTSATAPGGFTQARASIRLNVPRTLSNGNVSVDTIELKLSADGQTTVAEKQEMLNLVAQACTDADFTEFFTNLAMS